MNRMIRRSSIRVEYISNGKGDRRLRCRDCGRWISYYNVTKTFDGCYYCSGEQE